VSQDGLKFNIISWRNHLWQKSNRWWNPCMKQLYPCK